MTKVQIRSHGFYFKVTKGNNLVSKVLNISCYKRLVFLIIDSIFMMIRRSQKTWNGNDNLVGQHLVVEWLVRDHQFNVFHTCSVSVGSLKTKFEWGPLDRGLKLGWGGFRLLDAIFRKWCEVKLR